jgi:hypothetical protein
MATLLQQQVRKYLMGLVQLAMALTPRMNG